MSFLLFNPGPEDNTTHNPGQCGQIPLAWAHVDHHYISKSYLKNLQVILTDGV